MFFIIKEPTLVLIATRSIFAKSLEEKIMALGLVKKPSEIETFKLEIQYRNLVWKVLF